MVKHEKVDLLRLGETMYMVLKTALNEKMVDWLVILNHFCCAMLNFEFNVICCDYACSIIFMFELQKLLFILFILDIMLFENHDLDSLCRQLFIIQLMLFSIIIVIFLGGHSDIYREEQKPTSTLCSSSHWCQHWLVKFHFPLMHWFDEYATLVLSVFIIIGAWWERVCWAVSIM